jgi:hypothetical protein
MDAPQGPDAAMDAPHGPDAAMDAPHGPDAAMDAAKCIATLQKRITEQQEAYALLYERNLLLYTELTEACQTIVRLSTLLNPTTSRAS